MTPFVVEQTRRRLQVPWIEKGTRCVVDPVCCGPVYVDGCGPECCFHKVPQVMMADFLGPLATYPPFQLHDHPPVVLSVPLQFRGADSGPGCAGVVAYSTQGTLHSINVFGLPELHVLRPASQLNILPVWPFPAQPPYSFTPDDFYEVTLILPCTPIYSGLTMQNANFSVTIYTKVGPNDYNLSTFVTSNLAVVTEAFFLTCNFPTTFEIGFPVPPPGNPFNFRVEVSG